MWGEVLSRGWKRCSGEGDRCTVPGHTAMPESAFREHWPPALRLRSLCGIEKGGVRRRGWVALGAGVKEGGTSNRFRRTQPPRARHEYTVRRSAGRSDVPNEYQQAQPPPPPLSPLPALLRLSIPLFLSLLFSTVCPWGENEFYFRGRGARADTNDCSDSVFPARRTASCFSEPGL